MLLISSPKKPTAFRYQQQKKSMNWILFKPSCQYSSTSSRTEKIGNSFFISERKKKDKFCSSCELSSGINSYDCTASKAYAVELQNRTIRHLKSRTNSPTFVSYRTFSVEQYLFQLQCPENRFLITPKSYRTAGKEGNPWERFRKPENPDLVGIHNFLWYCSIQLQSMREQKIRSLFSTATLWDGQKGNESPTASNLEASITGFHLGTVLQG